MSLINDIDGNNITGFKFRSEILDPDDSNEFNTYRMRLSETTVGLSLSATALNPQHGEGETGGDVKNGGLTAENSNKGLVVNLSDFSIPDDSDPVFAQRIVNRVSTVAAPGGEDQVTGYELYTRETNDAGIVSRHVFNRDGSHRILKNYPASNSFKLSFKPVLT